MRNPDLGAALALGVCLSAASFTIQAQEPADAFQAPGSAGEEKQASDGRDATLKNFQSILEFADRIRVEGHPELADYLTIYAKGLPSPAPDVRLDARGALPPPLHPQMAPHVAPPVVPGQSAHRHGHPQPPLTHPAPPHGPKPHEEIHQLRSEIHELRKELEFQRTVIQFAIEQIGKSSSSSHSLPVSGQADYRQEKPSRRMGASFSRSNELSVPAATIPAIEVDEIRPVIETQQELKKREEALKATPGLVPLIKSNLEPALDSNPYTYPNSRLIESIEFINLMGEEVKG